MTTQQTSKPGVLRTLLDLGFEPKRNIFVSRKFNYVFVANNKCATSTIKLVLYRAEVGDFDYKPPNVHRRKGTPVVGPADIPEEEFEAMAAGSAFRFTFVRNPYVRLASAYRDKVERLAVAKVSNGPEYRDDVFRNRMKKEFGLSTTSEIERFSFADFVEAIGGQETRAMNVHWRPQTINTYYDFIDFDFIGRVETFLDDMNRVSGSTGLPLERLGVTNTSNVSAYLADYYTAGLADRAFDIYRDDFEAFGYERALPIPPPA